MSEFRRQLHLDLGVVQRQFVEHARSVLRRTLTTLVGSLVAERSIPAVLDPPYFGLDGSALAVRSAEGDTVRTEQVHQLKDGL
jgi:hypothetical protein